MTKYAYDLNKLTDINTYSSKYFLSDDEIFYMARLFTSIAENSESIPEDIFNAMADIQSQFEKDHRLSQKQISYVDKIHTKYCT
jgi:hypothetical protein